MEEGTYKLIIVILIGVIIYLGFIYPQDLKNKYNQVLEENSKLKIRQKELTNEIALYLLDQTTIDLLGLKKYGLAYNLIRIVICNKNPAIIFC